MLETIVQYLFIVFIVFFIYILYTFVLGPYINTIQKKRLYGDQVQCDWFPLLGFFFYVLRSIKVHKNFYYFLTDKVRKNPKTKAYYTSGFASQNFWILLDSEYQKQMLQNHDNYTKSEDTFFLNNMYFNGGLFFSIGKEWKRQRQMVSDAFHFQSLKEYTPIINTITDNQLKEVVPGKMDNIVSTCSMIAGKVVASTFFGSEFYEGTLNGKSIIMELQQTVQEVADYKKNVWHLIKQSIYKNYPKHKFLMSSYEKQMESKIVQLMDYINVYVKKLIDEDTKIKGGQKPQNFQEMILSEYYKGNTNEKEIMQNFWSFFFAGIDTTGNFAAFCFYQLGLQQDLQKRIYNSVFKYFNESRENFDPNNFEVYHDDINKITDLNNFVKETFRFNNPAPGLLFRTVLKSHKIGDLLIEKGSLISLITGSNMRQEKYFKDPDTFDIDRWNSEETQKIDPYAYIPFSAGPRNCLGQHLSLIELKIILIKYIMKYQVFKNPDKELVLFVKIIGTPLEEDIVYFEKRK